MLEKLSIGDLIDREREGDCSRVVLMCGIAGSGNYGIQNQEVAQVMESLLSIAPPIEIKSLKQSSEDQALRYARTCYDHLAGSLGVQLTNTLLRTGILREEEKGFIVTEKGEELFTSLQIDLGNVKSKRRSFSHKCLDWSERRHHLAGALGNALLEKLLELNWVQRLPNTRAITITSEGKIGFKEVFLMDIEDKQSLFPTPKLDSQT